VPTYQYACTNPEGKHEFEVVQSFTDAPVAECPTCTATVRKVYGSIGVVFKGSGFYRTDSRAGSAAGGAEKAPSEGSSSKEAPSKESSPKESPSKDSSPATASTPASTSSTGSSGSKAAAG
jgi:putative FmdB family regulatory protein